MRRVKISSETKGKEARSPQGGEAGRLPTGDGSSGHKLYIRTVIFSQQTCPKSSLFILNPL
jgi:hypothetical protein